MKKPKKSAGCNTPKIKSKAELIQSLIDAWKSVAPGKHPGNLVNQVDKHAKLAPKPIVNLLEVQPSDHSATVVMLLDRLPPYGVETLGKNELVDDWLKSQGIKYCSVLFKWN